MEILHYTKEHHAFRERLRAFLLKEAAPFSEQWERDHMVPRSAWEKMGKEGFLGTAVPAEFGGMGGDFLYSVIVCEEMSKIGVSGLMASLHSDVVLPYLMSYGPADLKKKYLPGCVAGTTISAIAMTEPGAGSDLSSLQTTAVEEGDAVVISGSKTFISNGINCDFAIVAAKDPAVNNPHQAISLYLVEASTPGFERGQKLDKMGMHSQDTAELFFNKCRVPKSNMLGHKGFGFIMLMEKLQQERLVCSMGAIFGAETVLEKFRGYCRTTRNGGAKPLSRHPEVQFALVEMAAEIKIGRTFIETLIVDHMQGRDIKVETSMAKFWTTEMMNRAINRCLEIAGEDGVLEKNPLARGFRDARITTIFAGTNEIMKTIVARLTQL